MYSDLFIHPYEWNFLHVVAIFHPKIELIDACINKKIPFLVDNNGFTPLHYVLLSEHQDITVINYFLAKFGDLLQNQDNLYPVLRSLSKDLRSIIKLGTFQAANFLQFVLTKPEAFEKNDGICFGTLDDVSYEISKTTVLDDDLTKVLVGKQGDSMVSIKVVGFEFDYTSVSKDMLNLMLFFNNLDDPDIYNTPVVSVIIDYLYSKNKSYFYPLTFIYTAIMILFSVYCGQLFQNRSWQVEVALLVFASILLLYELLMAWGDILLYVTDPWNFIDVSFGGLLIASIASIWTTGNTSTPSITLLSVSVFFGYMRWVSYFRIFEKTSRVIHNNMY